MSFVSIFLSPLPQRIHVPYIEESLLNYKVPFLYFQKILSIREELERLMAIHNPLTATLFVYSEGILFFPTHDFTVVIRRAEEFSGDLSKVNWSNVKFALRKESIRRPLLSALDRLFFLKGILYSRT